MSSNLPRHPRRVSQPTSCQALSPGSDLTSFARESFLDSVLHERALSKRVESNHPGRLHELLGNKAHTASPVAGPAGRLAAAALASPPPLHAQADVNDELERPEDDDDAVFFGVV